MYYSKMKEIVRNILEGTIDKNEIRDYLINQVDCEKVYDSDNPMLTDLFFTLKHYVSGEENIGKEELMYFLDCLSGRCEYNFEKKAKIKTGKINNKEDNATL